jgi:hypothetical protein
MSGECAHSFLPVSVVGSTGYETAGTGMSLIVVPFHPVFGALRRARSPILWIGLTHLLGVAVGGVMVHARWEPALAQRDRIVGRAIASDPVMAASQMGFPVRAALLDFAENLGRGAVPSTVMGLGLIFPFPVAADRGWVGGIVAVDGEHKSRLRNWHEASYYLGVLLLQLIPYSLAGGAGVRLGMGFLFPKGRWGYKSSRTWLNIPIDGVMDVARIYALVVPLFLVASLVEFLLA